MFYLNLRLSSKKKCGEPNSVGKQAFSYYKRKANWHNVRMHVSTCIFKIWKKISKLLRKIKYFRFIHFYLNLFQHYPISGPRAIC